MNKTPENLKPINIMIIDDDNVVLFIYEKIINTAGIPCNITSFPSAFSAMEALRKATPSSLPDLMFVDINMPIMNGWEFMEQYRKITNDNQHEKNVICMSSSSIDEFDKKMCERYEEINEYIIKPLTSDTFNKLIEKYFNKTAKPGT